MGHFSKGSRYNFSFIFFVCVNNAFLVFLEWFTKMSMLEIKIQARSREKKLFYVKKKKNREKSSSLNFVYKSCKVKELLFLWQKTCDKQDKLIHCTCS